jgi:archaeosine synthase beta-subunit
VLELHQDAAPPDAAAVRNAFLSQVTLELRRDCPLLPDAPGWTLRTEVVDGQVFARLWFRTAGCTHDRRGSCAFCNYGRGSNTTAEEMVGFVRDGLRERIASSAGTLLISPSGSMFDPREVPELAQEAIWRLVAATQVRQVLCESRAETVTDAALLRMREALPDRRVAVELGVESADPWVARWVVNKGLRLRDYLSAVGTIRRHRVTCLTNVVVGLPFLTVAETIDDSVRTIRVAQDAGSDACVLFPLHVRPWTVLEWLWRHGTYRPPSLWSLVEVLHRLGPERAARVSISWYRDYDRDDSGPAKPVRGLCAPTTCPACEPDVLSVLDEYRAGAAWEVVERLVRWPCACRQGWVEDLAAPAAVGLVARVARAYELLGSEVLGEGWWQAHGGDVLELLTGDPCRPAG